MTATLEALIGQGAGQFHYPIVANLTSAPDGGWPTLGGIPFYANGYTYFGFVDNAGHVKAAQYVHATKTVNTFTLKTLTADQHNRPTLLRRSSDGKLVAWYCDHAGAAMYQRISSAADDISAWGSETNLDSSLGSTAYTYPLLMEITGESKLYAFYRDQDGVNNWEIATSSDDGATWSAFTNLFFATRAYGRAWRSSTTRIDFLCTDGSYCADKASLYHFYYEGGSYYTSAGVAITGSPPFAFSKFTKVYDGASQGAWAPSTMVKFGSQIAVGFAVTTGTCVGSPAIIGSDMTYQYALWNGSTWTVHDLAAAIGADSVDYSEGDLKIDTLDLSRVFVSKRSGSSIWNVWIYQTFDGGSTWVTKQLTSDATNWNLYPEVAVDHHPELVAMWLNGSFTDQSTFNDKIQGWGG